MRVPCVQAVEPIRTKLKGLIKNDLHHILTEPVVNVIEQHIELIKTKNMRLEFTDNVVHEVTRVTSKINQTVETLTRCACTRYWRKWSIGYVVTGMYTFYLVVFHTLSNIPLNEGLLYGVHIHFWQQPNIVVFICAGVSLTVALDQRVCGRSRQQPTQEDRRVQV